MLTIDLHRCLADFNIDVQVECQHLATAIYGPSGSGKTSLLNMVAGLLRPDHGRIELDGEVLYDTTAAIYCPPESRRLGYVFQQDWLFPHLSIYDNLRFGYNLLSKKMRRFEPSQICDLLEIGSIQHRRPDTLSGGERQRVALGRALLSSPRMLLMDEPLASLDQGLKRRIMPYLRHICSEFGIPILYVSHSVAEILELTGQAIVLDRGQVVAQGDLFHIASDPRVLHLIDEFGFENVLTVEMLPVESSDNTRLARCGQQVLRIPQCSRPAGEKLFVGVRAEDVILSLNKPEGMSVRNALQGKVTDIRVVEETRLVYVDVGCRLAVKVTPEAVAELGLISGKDVFCLVKTHSLRLGPGID